MSRKTTLLPWPQLFQVSGSRKLIQPNIQGWLALKGPINSRILWIGPSVDNGLGNFIHIVMIFDTSQVPKYFFPREIYERLPLLQLIQNLEYQF